MAKPKIDAATFFGLCDAIHQGTWEQCQAAIASLRASDGCSVEIDESEHVVAAYDDGEQKIERQCRLTRRRRPAV